MNEDIDMEDLEARLYGQVHYAHYADEDSSLNPNKPTCTSSQQQRYFTNFQTLSPIYTRYESPFMNTNTYSHLGFVLNPAAVNNIVVVQQPPAQPHKVQNIRQMKRRSKGRNSIQNRVPRFRGFKEHRIRHQIKLNKSTKFYNDHSEGESDDYSCQIIEVKPSEAVVISSDEESNVHTETSEDVSQKVESEDVIFVEPTPPEIITIDGDEEVLMNCIPSAATNCIEQNDFLEDSVIIAENTAVTNTQKATSSNIENSDSESSCTTSETQNRVFKEPIFESPNIDTSTLSLNDFENYITTSGSFVSSYAEVNLSTVSNKLNNSKTCNNSDVNTSDSSSESDYEDAAIISNERGNKTLPDLSHIVSDNDLNSSTGNRFNAEYSRSKIVDRKYTTGENKNVICISSSDDLSDVEIDTSNCIELLNIDGCKVFPKQELPTATCKTYKPSRFSNFWTEDMNKFYNESWGQENFNYEEEQNKMSDDPNMWKIIDKDLHVSTAPRGVRCHRCHQFGHKAVKCMNKSNIPKCIMCGFNGHYESKCPNKYCIACGEKIPFWTIYCSHCSKSRHHQCKMCSMPGHASAYCPDLWRRYHLTVSEGPLVRPMNNTVKPPEDRWCSGCALQGHYEHECNSCIRTHPRICSFVLCYDDVYGFDKQTQPNNVIQPEIPRLLDLQIDKNQIALQEKSQAIFITLSSFEASKLLAPKGVKFLKSISKKTDVQIKVLKNRCGNLTKYVCKVNGSDYYKSEATNKINHYLSNSLHNITLCSLFSKGALTRKNLGRKFDVFEKKLPWTRLIKDTYENILQYERQPNLPQIRNKLQSYYRSLNAVLIVMFKAGNQEQLNILKNWYKTKNEVFKDIVVYAYRYVFLNVRRMSFNYERMISNLPPDIDKLYYDQMEEFNSLMRSNSKLCRRLHLNKELRLLEYCYEMIVKDVHDKKHVNQFKKLCNSLKFKQSKRMHNLRYR